uniref:Uncharacterized protein n=1 Tax=Rhipicephalus zambeziensis TaxID=60191 RepID=A0A224YER6_9ACAR
MRKSNMVMCRAQPVVLISIFSSCRGWAGLETAGPHCSVFSSFTLRNISMKRFTEPSAFQVHWELFLERTTINLFVRTRSVCHTLNYNAPLAATCSDVKHNQIKAHLSLAGQCMWQSSFQK